MAGSHSHEFLIFTIPRFVPIKNLWERHLAAKKMIWQKMMVRSGFETTSTQAVLAVRFVLNAIPLSLIGKFSNGRLQNFGCHGDVAPGVFQGVDDHLFLQAGDGILQ